MAFCPLATVALGCCNRTGEERFCIAELLGESPAVHDADILRHDALSVRGFFCIAVVNSRGVDCYGLYLAFGIRLYGLSVAGFMEVDALVYVWPQPDGIRLLAISIDHTPSGRCQMARFILSTQAIARFDVPVKRAVRVWQSHHKRDRQFSRTGEIAFRFQFGTVFC